LVLEVISWLTAKASHEDVKVPVFGLPIAEVQVVPGTVVVVAQEDTAVTVVLVLRLKCVHGLSFLARSQKRMR